MAFPALDIQSNPALPLRLATGRMARISTGGRFGRHPVRSAPSTIGPAARKMRNDREGRGLKDTRLQREQLLKRRKSLHFGELRIFDVLLAVLEPFFKGLTNAH